MAPATDCILVASNLKTVIGIDVKCKKKSLEKLAFPTIWTHMKLS